MKTGTVPIKYEEALVRGTLINIGIHIIVWGHSRRGSPYTIPKYSISQIFPNIAYAVMKLASNME